MQSKGKRETTDELLARSFKELLCKLPMEKITIKDITDKAGVIRPTFYNHFRINTHFWSILSGTICSHRSSRF